MDFTFDNSKFDPKKWNLGELALDEDTKPFADLAAALFASEEWQANFAGRVPDLHKVMAESLRDQIQQTRANAENIKRDTAAAVERAAGAARAAQEFARTRQQPLKPVLLTDRYQLTVRLTDPQTRLGLPSVVVQLLAGEKPIAETTTDLNGNALLSLSLEEIRQNQQLVAAVVPTNAANTRAFRLKELQPKPGLIDALETEVPQPPAFKTAIEQALDDAKDEQRRVATLQDRVKQAQSAGDAELAETEARLKELTELLEPGPQ